MKKTLSLIVLLGFVASMVLTGCGEKAPEHPAAPEVPTNAPAK